MLGFANTREDDESVHPEIDGNGKFRVSPANAVASGRSNVGTETCTMA